LLAEEARTNSIRNSTMQGAVAPNIAPTGWAILLSPPGVSRTVSVVNENGMVCLDINVTGTPTVGGSLQINHIVNTDVSATSGQVWTYSNYLRVSAGQLPGNVSHIFQERDAAGASTTVGTTTLATITDAPIVTQRRATTRTLSGGASIAFVTARTDVFLPANIPVDFTLRIGLPQLELGASTSSPIPTFGTALTRSADNLSMTDMSWYSASGGVLYCDYTPLQLLPTFRYALFLSDNSTANFVGITASTPNTPIKAGLRVSANTALQVGLTTTDAALSRTKIAGLVSQDNFAACVNGGAVSKDTAGDMPQGLSVLNLGSVNFGAAPMHGIIREIAFIPNANISDRALQALTK
jgi:hypothetical protein